MKRKKNQILCRGEKFSKTVLIFNIIENYFNERWSEIKWIYPQTLSYTMGHFNTIYSYPLFTWGDTKEMRSLLFSFCWYIVCTEFLNGNKLLIHSMYSFLSFDLCYGQWMLEDRCVFFPVKTIYKCFLWNCCFNKVIIHDLICNSDVLYFHKSVYLAGQSCWNNILSGRSAVISSSNWLPEKIALLLIMVDFKMLLKLFKIIKTWEPRGCVSTDGNVL